MSVKNPTNTAFIKQWKEYVKKNSLPGGDSRVTNDPMEATRRHPHVGPGSEEGRDHQGGRGAHRDE